MVYRLEKASSSPSTNFPKQTQTRANLNVTGNCGCVTRCATTYCILQQLEFWATPPPFPASRFFTTTVSIRTSPLSARKFVSLSRTSNEIPFKTITEVYPIQPLRDNEGWERLVYFFVMIR